MKKLTTYTNTLKLLTVSLALLVITFTLSNCKKQKDDGSPNTSNTSSSPTYLNYTQCSETHIIGTSPCPQLVCTNKVFCYADKTFSGCTADSAVITNHHPGLICTFKHNGKFESALPLDGSGEEIEVLFSCSVPELIIHTYNIEIYKGGKIVKVEKFEVSVVVK